MSERTIWKFRPNPPFGKPTVMPRGAQLLFVAEQDMAVTVWALVDPEQPKAGRHIYYYGTGHQIPDGMQYVGSMQAGNFVWHVFDGGEA